MKPDFSQPLVETEDYRISAPQPVSGKLSAFPDVAIDSTGHAWVVWVETVGNLEEIRAARMADLVTVAPLTISEAPGVHVHPCIVSLGHGSLRVFWVTRRGVEWQLLTRSFHGRELGPIASISENQEGVFRPRAALDSAGRCHVVSEYVAAKRSSLSAFIQSGQSWVSIDFPETDGECFRPQLAVGPSDKLWVSYDLYKGGRYQICLHPLTESGADHLPLIALKDDTAQCLQSSLSTDSTGNLWIGYASNRNCARRDPTWMTKWSYVEMFDGSSILIPAADRQDLDVYNEHAYQGFEFPAIAVLSNDAVIIAGQSAHSIVTQSCSLDRWTNLETVVTKKWGSWKPQCRIAGADPAYLASMGLDGVQIQQIVPKDSGRGIPMVVPPQNSVVDITPLDETANSGIDRGISSTHSDKLSIFFGDLHAHSVYSDGTGDVDEFYNRYRDWYKYDFAALTDHDYLDGIRLSRSELELLWSHADRVSEDDVFIAFHGYEWTSPAISVHAAEGTTVGEGHRHIIYPDKSGPLVNFGDADSDTGKKLLTKLKGLRALVIPHHSSWSGTDWDAHDPDLQRVIEIVSTHGRFEHPGNQPIGYRRDHIHPEKFVVDALNRGYKLGFVGGSDSHGLRWHAIELEGRAPHIEAGTRVGWKEDAYRSGMTAVLCKSLDRDSLFEAIHNRRCYATSGVPIVLDFSVDGEMMGSDITVTGPPRIGFTVTGTSGLRSVEIIRNGHLFGGSNFLPGQSIAKAGFEMTDDVLIPGESVYYYLRVIQEDGNMAWSSPIWVTYE